MFLGILIFVAGIFLMIFVHELGHFLTAKRFGIKVQEFFIGFGPRLWSFRRGETEYGLKAIPVGGYVKIAGMNPLEEPPPEDRPRLFTSKPRWQRAIVLVAGTVSHFLLAFLILMSLFLFIGMPVGGAPVITKVEESVNGRPSPASVAGLQSGDLILEADGLPIRSQDELGDYIASHQEQAIVFLVWRDGAPVRVRATPTISEIEGEERGRLGILIGPQRRQFGPIESAVRSGRFIPTLVAASFSTLGQAFGPEGIERIFGAVFRGEERTARDPVGIVGAARVSGQAVEAGQLDIFLYFFAFFNVFVGILNALPLPPLDGGHLAVLGLEAVSRRRIDPRRLLPITAVVAGFLILLTFSLLYLDITAPIPNPFQ